jgi:GTP-binding protein LepA
VDEKLRALVFDSHYDSYRGVLVYIRVISGEISRKSLIRFMASDKTFEVLEVGIFSPNEKAVDTLQAGEVGYISCNIKKTSDVKIGETITLKKNPVTEPLAGFRLVSPVVFAGIYSVDTSDFEALREALAKLQLNDAALDVEQESSLALGFGFRCGFLGLLHLEIIFERLQREFDLDIIMTAPSVVYKFALSSGVEKKVDNVAFYPDPALIDYVEEPWVRCHVVIPAEFVGPIMSLALEKRGEQIHTESFDGTRLLLTYRFPLNEIITDFNDKLKSATRGYGSFDYAFDKYELSDISKLEIRINGEPVDAFSSLVHRSKAEQKGRDLCKKLKEVIPRQQFKVAIQAAIGGKIIARETISALSKNVTAKCYGGDITRKRKLLENQREGKKRMKRVGKVNIPQSAFMDVLKE